MGKTKVARPLLSGSLHRQDDPADGTSSLVVRVEKARKRPRPSRSSHRVAQAWQSAQTQATSETSWLWQWSERLVLFLLRLWKSLFSLLNSFWVYMSFSNWRRQRRLLHQNPTLSGSSKTQYVVLTPEQMKIVQYWNRRVAYAKKYYGLAHVNTAQVYMQAGQAQLSLQAHQAALEAYCQAKFVLMSWRQTMDLERTDDEFYSLTLARIYEGMGKAMMMTPAQDANDTSRLEHAIDLIQEAHDLRCKYLGPHHVDVTETKNTWAAAQVRLQNFPKAIGAYREVLQHRAELFGYVHPSVAVAAHALAKVYHSGRRYKTAHSYYQAALEIYRECGVSNKSTTVQKVMQDARQCQKVREF